MIEIHTGLNAFSLSVVECSSEVCRKLTVD